MKVYPPATWKAPICLITFVELTIKRAPFYCSAILVSSVKTRRLVLLEGHPLISPHQTTLSSHHILPRWHDD